MDIYRERAHLVAYLASLWPSYVGYTDPNEPEWQVVTVETSRGQMTWHVSPNDMDLFGHIDQTNPNPAAWDGHSTEGKYERLAALSIDEAMGNFKDES